MRYWKNFLGVAYSEFWDRINYYGLQSILVLYLTQKLGFSDNESFNVFGAYVALAFGFTILGGFIADKILGFYNTTVLGAILIFFGNLILIQPEIIFFYLGLAFVILGIGLLKPSNPSLVGFMCKEDSYLRTKIFSAFYFCLNMGCILGPIVYGLAIQNNEYKYCYALSAVGIISAVVVLLYQKNSFRKHIEPAKTLSIQNFLFILITVVFSIILCTFLLIEHNLFFWFLLAVLIVATCYFIKAFRCLTTNEKKSLIALVVPFISSIIFFTMLLQMYSSIILYADRDLDKHFFGYTIPTAWFSSIEPIFVSLLIPFLTYAWKKLEHKKRFVPSESKIIFGLFIACISFVLFAMSALFTKHAMVAIAIVVFADALLAIGELSVIPISMSLTNILAPEKLKGTAMGFYYFSLMSSGYLAGQIAKLAPPNQVQMIGFPRFFLILAGILFAIGIIMCFVQSKFLKKS